MHGDKVMIKAVLFDLDGTLVDSELLWCKALVRVAAAQGITVTDAYSYELVFGRAWRDIAAKLRSDYPTLRGTNEELEKESILHYAELRGATDIRIHSSIALLERLASRYPVAIVSGSTRRQVSDAVDLMGVREKLRFFFGNEDYPRGKPDPVGFLRAAEQLGVTPRECLVFEDSAAGVKAAKAAGMSCVALIRHNLHPQDVSAADQILTDLAEFNPGDYGMEW